jgi:RimJ/RimL family protein N-acetyltransferase
MSAHAAAPRVALRELRPGDAETIYAYRTDEDVSRYQGWTPGSVEEVRAFIGGLSAVTAYAPGSWHQLGIELISISALIGDCGVHVEADNAQAEFGITLAPAFHGHGYAAETVRALLTLLFGRLGMHRVFASVDPRNARSIVLMERLGFRREAHFIESLWFKEAWADDIIFALLEREWKSGAATGAQAQLT